jgi:hypothetical protein
MRYRNYTLKLDEFDVLISKEVVYSLGVVPRVTASEGLVGRCSAWYTSLLRRVARVEGPAIHVHVNRSCKI